MVIIDNNKDDEIDMYLFHFKYIAHFEYFLNNESLRPLGMPAGKSIYHYCWLYWYPNKHSEFVTHNLKLNIIYFQ